MNGSGSPGRGFPEPDLSGEAGWDAIQMPVRPRVGTTFIGDDPDNRGLRVRMYVRAADCRLFAKAWYGPEAEGPPGHAHGGSMAAVLDHCMGVSAWVAGHPVVAANISIDFHRMLPLGSVATCECWIDRIEGKKVYPLGRLYGVNPDTPYASGSGLFIRQPLETFAALADTSKNA